MKHKILTLATACATATSTPAALVTLADPGFESQLSGTQFPTTNPGADGGWWRDTFLSPGGNGGMIYVNDASAGDGGARVALLGFPPELRSLQQTVSTAFLADTDYMLTVYSRAIAYGNFTENETAELTLTLFDGVTTTVIKEATFTVAKGLTGAAGDKTFTATAAEIANAGAVGRPIGIRLEKSALGPAIGGAPDGRIELRVDNVRLDAIPEPTTAGLFAVASMYGLRRRRRNDRPNPPKAFPSNSSSLRKPPRSPRSSARDTPTCPPNSPSPAPPPRSVRKAANPGSIR